MSLSLCVRHITRGNKIVLTFSDTIQYPLNVFEFTRLARKFMSVFFFFVHIHTGVAV